MVADVALNAAIWLRRMSRSEDGRPPLSCVVGSPCGASAIGDMFVTEKRRRHPELWPTQPTSRRRQMPPNFSSRSQAPQSRSAFDPRPVPRCGRSSGGPTVTCCERDVISAGCWCLGSMTALEDTPRDIPGPGTMPLGGNDQYRRDPGTYQQRFRVAVKASSQAPMTGTQRSPLRLARRRRPAWLGVGGQGARPLGG